MKSSLYTCIQDIQNGDREQALALLEKFSPLLKKYPYHLCCISMYLALVHLLYK